jgi:hypothetical protein
LRRPTPATFRRRRRLLAAGVVLALAAVGSLVGGLWGGAPTRASALLGAPELLAQTDDSAPAKSITLFGASPEESAGEVWGTAERAGSTAVVTYSQGGGWALAPSPEDAEGQPLKGFHLDTPEAFAHKHPSPLAAQMTPDGAAAMLGSVGASSRQVLLTRNPGGAFRELPVPSGEEGLQEGESLFGINRQPLLAALEEPAGKAGAFVVPIGAHGVDGAVLHWDGSAWKREPIEVPAAGSSQFEVLSISAASPSEAWLLARLGGTSGSLALFRRQGGASPSWQPVTLRAGGKPGEAIEYDGEAVEEPSAAQSQLLSATSSGVWVDGRLHGTRAPITFFFAPTEGAAGAFTGAWCAIPAGASSVPPQLESDCSAHPLPEPLPTDFSRSFAWAGSGGYGERIITGMRDGQLMRLVGGRFELLDTLGGQAGGEFGAAFASANEGWLGKQVLPVHVTTSSGMAPNRLTPWPVPFRFALTAAATQPGAAAGAETSEAVAVGDRGEVARFHPNCPAPPSSGACQGAWLPETLPGPGGKRQTPRLRAVAWPTPGRVFAVGDSEKGAGQMWLWRGETGLWEKDPATPLNFRGNLLGIAFDPNDSARGYAVGQRGVLLRYGKSWTQEPEEAIPPAARGASFTAVAFAGSEAIVAWRKLLEPGQNRYAGGIIVNSGSGWREDEGAAAVLGTKAAPWALAALPDGGAAFTARSPTEGGFVYERNGPGQAWQGYVYPGNAAPGSLSVFREGGALRAIGTGSEPETFVAEEEVAPPPGFPPIIYDPYPLVSDPQRGLLRQTASGWSDQEHELNDAQEPPGGYFYWDTPKVPDPVNAVLVDPSGAQGWAVGGIVDNKHALLDTADIYRYPADGKVPAGLYGKPETTGSGYTTVAIGGGAGCAAPCETRANTGTGPAVWLQGAIKESSEVGIKSFVYTGPGVTDGRLAGPPLLPVPWQSEEQYYAQRASAGEITVCTAASPTDREGTGQGGIAFYESFFKEAPGCREKEPLGPNYAFRQGELTVIVIDTSFVQGGQREVMPGEVEWLQRRLAEAGGRAIVVGNADLAQEYAEGHSAARELVAAIEAGKAAGYFFDAPEQNVRYQTLTGAAKGTPAYGSGTLGYVNVSNEEVGGFIGQSGFLLAEVSNAAGPEGRYEARVKLVPNVEELAIEAQQGTLLRRSQAASFAGLARRPRSGNRAHNQSLELETAPYIQIPANCLGSGCARGIEPAYEFHSSDTQYGEFVKRNLHSAEPNAVEHDAHGKPISQEAEGGKDGLFCAFNATPATAPFYVTLKVANLLYKLPVTIQAGSVRQPCGTTPLRSKPASAEAPVPPPGEPQGGPAQNSAPPTSVVLPPPAAPAPAPAPHLAPSPPLAPFIPQAQAVSFVPPFVPVPLPTPARPTPPSGTSAVTSPVEAAQKEEEEEAAPESVDAAATAYHPAEHELPPAYLLGLLVLAAFAGASLRGRRGPRRGERIAPATVSGSRAQRRLERGDPRRRR